MPRRGPIRKRKPPPDPIYQSLLVSQFVNALLKQGKKSTAERILYGAMEIIREGGEEDPLGLVKKAVDQVKPQVQVKSRRVGGATYQVPIEVPSHRQVSLALRWLIQYSRGRKGKSMRDRLASELRDAAEGKGGAVKKREDTHRMAEANRAFAHYRW